MAGNADLLVTGDAALHELGARATATDSVAEGTLGHVARRQTWQMKPPRTRISASSYSLEGLGVADCQRLCIAPATAPMIT